MPTGTRMSLASSCHIPQSSSALPWYQETAASQGSCPTQPGHLLDGDHVQRGGLTC